MNRLTLIAALALVPFAILPDATGWAVQQSPGQQVRRSPEFAQRRAQTADAVQELHAATGPNWRILPDEIVGTPLWAAFNPGVDALPAELRAGSPRGAVESFLARHGDLWGVPSLIGSLRELREKVDPRGGYHYFYRQVYRGVDVQGAELGAYVERDREGRYAVQTIYGRFHPDIDIDVAPMLSDGDAVRIVASETGALAPFDRVESERNVMLVGGRYRLTWRVELQAQNGAWVAHVDALDGTVLVLSPLARSFAGRGTAVAEPSRSPEPDAPDASVQAQWTTCDGTNVHENEVSFTCYYTGSTFQLRDNTNPSAAEIQVYDENFSADLSACTSGLTTLSNQTDGRWDEPAKQDEASAWENGDATLYFYRDRGRDGMTGNAPVLRLVASRVSAFQAVFCSNDFRLVFFEGGSQGISPTYFPGVISEFRPTAGGAAVVAHEFHHGVNWDEEAASEPDDFVARAINEGLADYFGGAKTGNACLADDIIDTPDPLGGGDSSPDSYAADPGCLRNADVDIDANSTFAAEAQAQDNEHYYGLIASSALYDSWILSPGNRTVFDAGVLDAIEFWLRDTPTLLEVRETVVRGIKGREQANEFPLNERPSYHTEYQFWENAVGPEAILVKLDSTTAGTKGDIWHATVEGSPGATFYAKMFAGSDINNDESVTDTVSQAANDPSFTIDADGRLSFVPGQEMFWFHTPDDGHKHSVRVRMTTPWAFGDLEYWDAHGGHVFLLSVTGEGSEVEERGREGFWIGQALGRNVPVGTTMLNAGRDGLIRASVADAAGRHRGSVWDPSYGITRLLISVPERQVGESGRVRVRIRDLNGRLILEAVDEMLPAGSYIYDWDGRDDDGRRMPPGVYIAVMEAPGYRGMAKLVLTR